MSAKSHFPLPSYPSCDDWKRHHAGGVKMQTRTGQNEFRDQRLARLEKLAQVGGPPRYVRAPPLREMDPPVGEAPLADPRMELSTMSGKELRQEARSMGMTKQEIQEMTRAQLEARVSAGRRQRIQPGAAAADGGSGFSMPGDEPKKIAGRGATGLGTGGAQSIAKAQSAFKDNSLPVADGQQTGPAEPTAKQHAVTFEPHPGYVDVHKGLVKNTKGGWDQYIPAGTIGDDGSIMGGDGHWIQPSGMDYTQLEKVGGVLYDTAGKIYNTAKEMKDAVEISQGVYNVVGTVGAMYGAAQGLPDNE